MIAGWSAVGSRGGRFVVVVVHGCDFGFENSQ
jgi:hypothetical protein